MKEICIPIAGVADDKQAEVEVRVPSTGEVWRYRIESVSCNAKESYSSENPDAINTLQQFIGKYNGDWELIQIFGMNDRTGNIHMLYREKANQVINYKL